MSFVLSLLALGGVMAAPAKRASLEAPLHDGRAAATTSAAPALGVSVLGQVGQCTPGQCDQTRMCPMIYAPVCVRTANGTRTFSNSCQAEMCCYDTFVQGPCDIPTTPEVTRPGCPCPRMYDPVCGEDGNTYINPCLAQCAGNHNFTQGACTAARVIDIECTDGHAVRAVLDGINHTNIARWSFTAVAAGQYTISTCDSDMDTQLLIDQNPASQSASWLDRDSCGFAGEITNVEMAAGSVHTIDVRSFSEYREGTARLTVNSTVCPSGNPGKPATLGCGDEPWEGTLEPYTNTSIGFAVQGNMMATTVVLSSCGSAFDTVLTIFNNNGVQVGYNDDNAYLCHNYSAAIEIETTGSLLAVGGYTAVLSGYGGAGGSFTLALECGGEPPLDPCANCPNGTTCQLKPNNATCQNWFQNHSGSAGYAPLPRSCHGCFPPPRTNCDLNGRSCSRARGEFCSFTPSEDNAGTCCGAIYPRPAVCYSCISRLNPPSHFVCPRPTRPGPPVTTVLPPVTVPDAATCGDLEVDDQESCSRFCSNADKQGGVTKASIWKNFENKPFPGTSNHCCCLSDTGSITPEACCISRDHTPLPGPPAQCTLFGGCYQAGLALALNATIQAAVTTQNTRCDFTSPPGSAEFENCKAVQKAVMANAGPNFALCCPCMKAVVSDIYSSTAFLANLDCNA